MQLKQKVAAMLTSVYTPLFSAFLLLKILTFWAFVDFQRYESNTYKAFVDFYLNISLEELPVKKRQYQEGEARSWRTFKILHGFFALGYAVIILASIIGLAVEVTGKGEAMQETFTFRIIFHSITIPIGYLNYLTYTSLAFSIWVVL